MVFTMAGQNTSQKLVALRPEVEQSNTSFHSIYNELRVIAHSHRRRWQGNDTLNTTAIIHEAYAKMAEAKGNNQYKNRTHFYATASKAMRQVLVNYAERNRAEKRMAEVSTLDESVVPSQEDTTIHELLSVDKLLAKLESENERGCRIVECRVFGGMSIDETAQALDISPATVKRDWALLSAWLYRELHTKDN